MPTPFACSLIVSAACLTGFEFACRADPPDEKRPTRTDPQGEPLPEGASVRLGIVRYLDGTKLAFTPDSKQIIVVTNDGIVRTLDAATGRVMRRHPSPGTGDPAGLSLDGQRVLTIGKSEVSVWDIARGARLFSLPPSKDWQLAKASLAPDGKTVATVRTRGVGGESTKVWSTWDIATAKERLLETTQLPCDTHLMMFSPDGKRLLTHVPGKHGFRCWDLERGKEAWRSQREWYRHGVFSADSRTLLGFTAPKTWWTLDVATGEPVGKMYMPGGWPRSELAIAPDNRTVFLPLDDGAVLWDLIDGKEIRKLPNTTGNLGGPYQMTAVFAPDGRSLLTNFGILQRWDLASGKPLYTDTSHLGHLGHPETMCWAPDGKSLAAGSWSDLTVRVWDVASKSIRHNLAGHTSYVRVLVYTLDGKRLVTAGGDSTVRIWDTATGRELHCLRLHEQAKREDHQQVYALDLSADARRLTVMGVARYRDQAENLLSVWDMQQGTRIVQRQLLADDDLYVSHFLRNGKLLLGWSGGLMDVTTGRWTSIVPKLDGARLGGPCWLSADGRLAGIEFCDSANTDHLAVWEAASGLPIARLPTGSLKCAAFDPSRPFFVTAGSQVHVWDLRSGRAALSHPAWTGHRGGSGGRGMYSMAVDPAGRTIATGQSDGSILLWDAPAPDPVDRRPLTDLECDTFWTDLGGTDATRAYTAMWRLAGDPKRAVRLAGEKLQPVPPPDRTALLVLVKDLDDANFKRRTEAEKRLRDFGTEAVALLRGALDSKPSPEARKRLAAIVNDLETPKPLTGESLRQYRAVWMLELAGTAEAKMLLEKLVAGAEEAQLTREARTALERWRR